MLAYDLINTIALISLLGLICVAYGIRILFKGRVHYERIQRQGSSVLLGKGLMEMVYWSLQPLARALILLGFTPNQLSWTSLVFGGIAGTALAYGYFGFAALFATYSALLDSLDGIVARMTGVSSDAGEVLDAAVDRYVEFFFLAGLIIYYQFSPWLQAMGLAALAGSFMISYSTAKAEALHIPPPPGIMRRPERALYLILGAALSPIPMPFLESLFPSTHIMGYPLIIATFFVAVLANISAIERLWTIGRVIREREHLVAVGPQPETDLSIEPLETPAREEHSDHWALTSPNE